MTFDLMNTLKSAHIIEDDNPKAPIRRPEPAAPVQSFPATAQSSAPQNTMVFAPGAQSNNIILTAEDQERMKKISDVVYASASNYTTFVNMRTALGNTSDLNLVFNALKATNSGITPQKVLADIEAHMGQIDAQAANMEGALAKAREDRIDAPQHEIARLQQEIQAATQQITADTAKINDLQRGIQDADHAISDGSARFKAVLDTLRQPLLQSKQLLSLAK